VCSVSVLSGQGFAWAVSIPNWRAFRNLVLGLVITVPVSNCLFRGFATVNSCDFY